ncbi:MAG: hypothetical protein KKD44_12365 [Proteobacteria bacterium]|nr:hypothetical protein [Pseudomonadota bacterium]
MKKKILDRYSRTPENELIIDISAEKVEDLFNDLDKYAPYRKKELDQDLVDYLINSVREIEKERFVIHFRLAVQADDSLTTRVKRSIDNYFRYLKVLKVRELADMVRSSMILFIIGIVFLSLSVWTNQKILDPDGVVGHVFLEGLTIAGWVSLWNAITTFLINWPPHRREMKLYDRISKAAIHFYK